MLGLIELSTFRSCKCTSTALGGVTLWVLAPEKTEGRWLLGGESIIPAIHSLNVLASGH